MTEIKGKLSDVLSGILRIEVSAVQINALDFSPQYKDAINQSTLAATKTVAAQRDAERAKVEADIARIDAKLANPDFIARAPEEVVEGEREKREDLENRRSKILQALERLRRG